MDISFERGPEISRELRSLPADHYRLIRLQSNRSQGESLFVPIRSMQYLGIIDRAEVIFVDGQGPRTIELSWKNFRAGEREDLHAPVIYSCIYYHAKGHETMQRLQHEFFKALKLMEQRQPKPGGGTVTPFESSPK